MLTQNLSIISDLIDMVTACLFFFIIFINLIAHCVTDNIITVATFQIPFLSNYTKLNVEILKIITHERTHLIFYLFTVSIEMVVIASQFENCKNYGCQSKAGRF